MKSKPRGRWDRRKEQTTGVVVAWTSGSEVVLLRGAGQRRGPISEGGRRWAGAATIRISRELSETFWGHGEKR